ncbi:hypothetical protein V8G54_016561 [Vigna mungo]|uniref:Uncharacterized protein n=1 Tax=Vigna mungo TaxID=3915 RepID=A0AAQ3S195_VIGMU
MGAISKKQRWRIVRKAGNCADAALHDSCGSGHTNSQSLLSQPITLIWALARTNLITNLFLFSYKVPLNSVCAGMVIFGVGKCGTGFNGEIAEQSEGQRRMRMRERNEEVDSTRKKLLLVGDAWHARADVHRLGVAEVAMRVIVENGFRGDGMLELIDSTRQVHHHDRRRSSERFRRMCTATATAIIHPCCCDRRFGGGRRCARAH